MPHMPSTRTGSTVQSGATPSMPVPWSAARIEATRVPCQLGVGHSGPSSPGSVALGSRPSLSMARAGSEMKS